MKPIKSALLLAAAALALNASADLAYFQLQGGKLFDQTGAAVPTGTITGGVKVFLGDLSATVVGGTVSISEFGAPWLVGDLAVKAPFLGGTYATTVFSERPSTAIGQVASIVFDLNGGALEMGDWIAIIPFTVQDMAAVGNPAPALPQMIAPGDITFNIQLPGVPPPPPEYSLAVTVVGGGSVSAANGSYAAGTELSLTATPNTGWLFMGWSGDLIGGYTQTNISLLMNADKEITATFSNDADSDGLPNTEELLLGTDPRDNDSDDDGLLDAFEVYIHHTDPLDADSDDDGLNDGPEVAQYETNPTLFDSDGDGLGDGAEVLTHATDPLKADTDGDGLSDGAEVLTHATNPMATDSDGDTLSDYAEVITHHTNPNAADSDSDGLGDAAELITYLTDPNDADSDDDGLEDGAELATWHTDPLDADSDDDGLSDGLEVTVYHTNPNLGDTSGDGILDGYAVLKGLDPTVDQTGVYALLMITIEGSGTVTPESDLYAFGTNLTLEAAGSDGMLFTGWGGDLTGDYRSALTNFTLNGHMEILAAFSADADGDGLLNTNETAFGTNPRRSDTDFDGLGDADEIYTYGTDPRIQDMDRDGLTDGAEILIFGTDPISTDSDGDGFADGYEVSNGYDPASTNSTPELLAVIKTSIQFEFSAASGQVYRIEGTPELSLPWDTMEEGIVGNGGVVTRHYDVDVETNRFFRARRD